MTRNKESRKGWALGNEIWTIAQKEFENIESKWVSIGLDISLSNTVSDKNGVYMITGGLPKFIDTFDELNFNSPLYVGQSQSLKDRFMAHCKGLTGSSKLFDTWNKFNLKFNYLILEDSLDERDVSIYTNDIEAILINTFGPISNTKNQKISYLFEDIGVDGI